MIALHAGIDSGSTLTTWSLDPIAVIAIPLAAILYTRGLRSLGPRRPFHGSWRPWSFYLGLLAVAIALLSPLDHLADELFFAHMTQHMLITMAGAPLVLLGAPMIPMMRGIPRGARRKVVIPIAKSLPVRMFLRILTRPLVAWPLYTFLIIGWHFPVFFEAALEREAVHTLEHVLFATGAYVFWWNIIDPHPLRPNLSYLVRVPYIFISVVPAFVLGAFLVFAGTAWYAPYQTSAPLYGFTGLEDQQLGGVIMWIPGSFIIGAALVIDLFLAARTEQEAQLAREAAGDA
jgi:putative membrane protein